MKYAFPGKDGIVGQYYQGMTLRQYYASKIATKLFDADSRQYDQVAKKAFAMADAMIKFEENEKS